ncbi:uncharacterized protein TNCV_2312461 [Trichonephila clavipes]|nr:uncharacterized protein TNCV_2312461 [Trichonephila clavipes]
MDKKSSVPRNNCGIVTKLGMKVHVGETWKRLEMQRDCALRIACRGNLISFSLEYKTSNQSLFECSESFTKALLLPFFGLPDPQMCPIEHIWDHLGRRVGHPTSLNDLEAKLQQIWKEMSQDIIQNLYASMPDRIALCIEGADGLNPPFFCLFL